MSMSMSMSKAEVVLFENNIKGIAAAILLSASGASSSEKALTYIEAASTEGSTGTAPDARAHELKAAFKQ